MPTAAAGLLPGDRAAASRLIGAPFDDAWPLPDLLDILPMHAARADPRFGVWTIVERETDTVVGDIGFHAPPDASGVVEIGYSVVPSRRRRGYATEAARAMTSWALDQPGVTAVVAGTVPGNEASERTLERQGFRRTGSDHGENRWRLDGDRAKE